MQERSENSVFVFGLTSDYNSCEISGMSECVWWRTKKSTSSDQLHAVHERRDQRAFSSGAVYWATTKKNTFIKWRILFNVRAWQILWAGCKKINSFNFKNVEKSERFLMTLKNYTFQQRVLMTKFQNLKAKILNCKNIGSNPSLRVYT